MIATLRPVFGVSGTASHPRATAKSATNRSRRPIATGWSFLPTMQVASHWLSCGHTRPQTAGRALLSLRTRYAVFRSRRAVAAMKAGMSIPTGHPGTHRGFLQPRQRSDSAIAWSSA